MVSGTTVGPELLLALDGEGPRRAQLEDRLRELIRGGVLASGTRLPSSRALAADLGVSRRLVVEAYGQLLAEGYLQARQGAGTRVATAGGAQASPRPRNSSAPRAQFDFFPGTPDLSAFPRRLWLSALRDVLRGAPDSAFGYPDPRGTARLRCALAPYLRRVRGVEATPEQILICSGATQALGLLARVLVARGARVAGVEDPSLPPHRATLARAGLLLRALPVDELGVDPGAAAGCDAVLVTPAHQFPRGVTLAPERRGELLDLLARGGGFVIEDDYDAEFRYDRAPVGALQGLAPDRVAYVGTASKTLAPALRLGWIVLPAELAAAAAEAKAQEDGGCPAIEQLALARLIESAAYDRHLRQVRRSNRARRDALLGAVAEHLRGARVSGVAAGVHALVELAEPRSAAELVRACRDRSVAVYPESMLRVQARDSCDSLVLGYANLSPPAINEGVRRLAQALDVTARAPAVTQADGRTQAAPPRGSA